LFSLLDLELVILHVSSLRTSVEFDSGFLRPSTSPGSNANFNANTKTPKCNRRENCVSASSYLPSTSRHSTGWATHAYELFLFPYTRIYTQAHAHHAPITGIDIYQINQSEIDATRHIQQRGILDGNRWAKVKKWPRDLVPFYFVIYKVVFAIALTSGRGDASSEVGLAAIDLQYPYLILCQISDCQTYVSTLTKINMFDPIEVSDHISIALRYIISISLSLILNKWLMFIYWRY